MERVKALVVLNLVGLQFGHACHRKSLMKFQVNVGDRSLNDGSVESFVKQFFDNEFKFCSGFDDDAKIGRPPVDQILIELLNGRIITRSRNCRFKVDLPNSKVIA